MHLKNSSLSHRPFRRIDAVGTIGWSFNWSPTAKVNLIFGLGFDAESRGSEHPFNAGTIRNPPVGFVMRVASFDEMHFRVTRGIEVHFGLEIVVGIYSGEVAASALHALEQQQIASDVLVD